MAHRSIDLKTIACKGVKSFNLFQKPSIYAVVSVNDGTDQKQQQKKKKKTPVDHTGRENPEWDHPMRFELNGQDLHLEFELITQGNVLLLGDKVVGKACVPIDDLLAEGLDGSVHHVSYQVLTPDGKPNGVIRFSFKINSPEIKLPTPDPAVPLAAGDYYSPPPPAIQVDNYYPPPPPPDPGIPLQASNYYPPPPPPDLSINYPSLSPAVGYFPTPNPAVYYHAPAPAVGYFPIADGYYPPPPPIHEAYYPPPNPACCYPPPPPPHDLYGYRPESWDRGLYRYD